MEWSREWPKWLARCPVWLTVWWTVYRGNKLTLVKLRIGMDDVWCLMMPATFHCSPLTSAFRPVTELISFLSDCLMYGCNFIYVYRYIIWICISYLVNKKFSFVFFFFFIFSWIWFCDTYKIDFENVWVQKKCVIYRKLLVKE